MGGDMAMGESRTKGWTVDAKRKLGPAPAGPCSYLVIIVIAIGIIATGVKCLC